MEKRHSQNRLIYPYLILVIALVCGALILSHLWANLNQVVAFPWEGPTPTPTLWWRTPQSSTATAPLSAGIPAPATPNSPEMPSSPIGAGASPDNIPELIDD